MAAVHVHHENIPFWGIDLPAKNRPGVPYERPPRPLRGAHWLTPPRQVPTVTVLKRADLPRLTPVFGTATPPRGVSGKLRRAAYAYPDHLARHWLLLLVADRVDVVEHGFGDLVERAWPVAAIALAVGAGIGALRSRRRRWL